MLRLTRRGQPRKRATDNQRAHSKPGLDRRQPAWWVSTNAGEASRCAGVAPNLVSGVRRRDTSRSFLWPAGPDVDGRIAQSHLELCVARDGF